MSGKVDLEEIVRRSGLRSRDLTDRDSLLQIVAWEGKRFKVRWYQDDQVAERLARLLLEVRNIFPRFRGRVGQYLVLEYLEGAKPERTPDVLARVGVLLAELASVEGRHPLDGQFEGWCRALESVGVFHPRTIELILRRYAEWRPSAVRACLTHLDLTPRNLVVTPDAGLLPVDEKHLHCGPLHMGLSKVASQYTEDEFRVIRERYSGSVVPSGFDDPAYRKYLRLYWLIAQLVTNVTSRPRWIWRLRPILHRRRQFVLDLIGASRWMRLQEEIPLGLVYRRHHVMRLLASAEGKVVRLVRAPVSLSGGK